jgi:hypothetical protein
VSQEQRREPARHHCEGAIDPWVVHSVHPFAIV